MPRLYLAARLPFRPMLKAEPIRLRPADGETKAAPIGLPGCHGTDRGQPARSVLKIDAAALPWIELAFSRVYEETALADRRSL